MPLYEYQCDVCGHRFEAIRKFSDAPLEICPKCGGHIHKLASAPAFQFKGSGWYVTDYAKKDATAGGKSERSSDGAPKSEGSKDASPSGSDTGSDKAAGKSNDKSDKNATAGSETSSSSSAASTSGAPTKDQSG